MQQNPDLSIQADQSNKMFMATGPTHIPDPDDKNSGGKPVRIAIMDLDEKYFLIIEGYIRTIPGREFVVDWYGSYEDAIQQISKRNYDLYFTDHFLGNKTGLDLLREAADMDFDKPIILLTEFSNRAMDISAMENGATDCLAKTDINAEKLERCIRYSLSRSHMLDKLRSREVRNQNLFEKSRDGVFIADLELTIMEANPVARALLSIENYESGHTSLCDLIDDEAEKIRILDLLENGQHIDDLEIWLNKGEEEHRSCQLSLNVQKNEKGESMVHGVIRDITNSKKAQYTNLQIEKIAANERLMRMLTHEVRNPLNNIILSADQLLSEIHEQDKKDTISIIRRNSIRINNIITELLNLSRPAELVFGKEDLGQVLKNALKEKEAILKQKKIEHQLRLPDTPLSVVADLKKLMIAISNIIQNAIEAMEENGKLRVAIQDTDDHYTVSIRDNGPGIPAEFIPRVFDPFFTLKKNGAGLGLTAAYSILNSHKATVHVESKKGEGTLVMVSFPK